MGLIQTNAENGNGGRAVKFVARRLPRAVPGMLRDTPPATLSPRLRLVLFFYPSIALPRQDGRTFASDKSTRPRLGG
jgi:hypothetical protein